MKQIRIRFDCDGVIFYCFFVPIYGAIKCLRELLRDGSDVSVISQRGRILALFGRVVLEMFRVRVSVVGVGNNGAKGARVRNEGGCFAFVDDKLEHLLKLIPLQKEGLIERLILFSRDGSGAQQDLPAEIEKASSWPGIYQICQLAEN